MNKNYLNFAKFATLLLMFGLTVNYFAVKANSFGFSAQGADNHCAGADVVSIDPDSDDLGTYTSDGGYIDSVCVKSGPDHFVFTQGQTSDGCYTVTGIGTDSVTVTRTGDAGPECQAISHLDVLFTDPEVSPSPEVSPTPEVSPSPEVSPTPEVSPSPEVSPTPEVSPSPEVSPTPEVSPDPTTPPNSCQEEQSCPSHCGAGATDVPNGSCGVKHCNPVHCSDDSDEEASPIGGTSGQVLGATTDSYAATGVAEDIAFSLVGLTGTGLSGLGILIKRNEKK